MDSSSGAMASSGGSDLQEEINKRKRRMLSNRESARRSRMRKQKHLNDLMTQLSQLRSENDRVMASISMTTQHYLSLEAENSVLTAQVTELSHRLRSLDEIIAFMGQPCFSGEPYGGGSVDVSDSLSYVYGHQHILASSDMIMY